jgi:hypothetical protein
MKNTRISTRLLFLISGVSAAGQGTVIFDQQSSTNETPPFPGDGVTIQTIATPYGQSFTPTLASVGFIRLLLDDNQPGNGVGATVYVNLRSGSVGGPIIGTTAALTFFDSFANVATFSFPSPVSVTPGAVYYFQPATRGFSDQWNVVAGEEPYPGGSVWVGGSAVPSSDYWFREGIVIPEPSSGMLVALWMAGVCGKRLLSAQRMSYGASE